MGHPLSVQAEVQSWCCQVLDQHLSQSQYGVVCCCDRKLATAATPREVEHPPMLANYNIRGNGGKNGG